jgi:hypothetical protein
MTRWVVCCWRRTEPEATILVIGVQGSPWRNNGIETLYVVNPSNTLDGWREAFHAAR